MRYLHAAAAAWRPQPQAPPTFSAAPASVTIPASAAVIVWLAPGPVPAGVLDRAAHGAVVLTGSQATLANGGQASPVWRDDLGQPLVEEAAFGSGRVLRFTRPMTPERLPELLDAEFPAHLRAALAPPAPAPSRVEATDYAPLTGARPGAPPAQDLSPPLAAIIIAVFAAERWLATRRRRAVAP